MIEFKLTNGSTIYLSVLAIRSIQPTPHEGETMVVLDAGTHYTVAGQYHDVAADVTNVMMNINAGRKP